MSDDLIGDIHGCADTLKALLETLGYSRRHGVYEHSQRQAIFLGDFVDRGPKQCETLEIVRPMIDQGCALSVTANHEFNAVAYATPTRDGNRRSAMRARWWDDTAETYQEAYLGPPEYLDTAPEDPLSDRLPLAYGPDAPVFIGHYWQTGQPEPLAINVACLDYSVGKHGSLTAYRWDGEQELSAENFVTVERLDP